MRVLRNPASEPTEVDDLTLARAQRGDAAAFRAIVACHQQTVFAFLWRMIGSRGDRGLVEDLTQDTFVRVYRGLASFSIAGPARLRTWILTIATRVALNDLRRRRVKTEPIARARDIVDRGDAALALIVRDALDHMTADHRAVLVLREYHQLDYQEIALVLEIDEGTVKSRLSRARAALRDALEDE
jgi:RNA polymerase sigma-70 factor (ECF subfamily)